MKFITFVDLMTEHVNQHLKFRDGLRKALEGDLPGVSSQLKMIPAHRHREMKLRNWKEEPRRAAVLICFFPDGDDEIYLALIRRNEYDGVHSGQISFPGGREEKEDRDLVHTALREAEEEINIRQHDVHVLGEITPVYIPPSNFLVNAVVGWTGKKPEFIPEVAEVQEILRIPLIELLNPENRQKKDIAHKELNITDVPCFYIQDHIIWGATAMMLSEVVDVVMSIDSVY